MSLLLWPDNTFIRKGIVLAITAKHCIYYKGKCPPILSGVRISTVRGEIFFKTDKLWTLSEERGVPAMTKVLSEISDDQKL